MEIKLQDAPDILFDQQGWRDFCNQFADKANALAAISGPPARTCGYHEDNDPHLPTAAQARIDHVETTYRLGNDLIGSFRQSLISGELKSMGIVYHLHYQEGEMDPVEIPPAQWQRLWPIFNENGAMGGERYEDVRIRWDGRQKRGDLRPERLLKKWMEEEQKSRPLLKVQLASMARERFGDIPERLFNRIYSQVFKRKRGRPRGRYNRQ